MYVAGTMESVTGNTVYVISGSWLIPLRTDRHTEIWKNKTFHDLSPLKPAMIFWHVAERKSPGI